MQTPVPTSMLQVSIRTLRDRVPIHRYTPQLLRITCAVPHSTVLPQFWPTSNYQAADTSTQCQPQTRHSRDGQYTCKIQHHCRSQGSIGQKPVQGTTYRRGQPDPGTHVSAPLLLRSDRLANNRRAGTKPVRRRPLISSSPAEAVSLRAPVPVQMKDRQHLLHVCSPVLGALHDGRKVQVLNARHLDRADASALLEDALPDLGPAQTAPLLSHSTALCISGMPRWHCCWHRHTPRHAASAHCSISANAASLR